MLWLYLERATSFLVIDDYYVPPSINEVYTYIHTAELPFFCRLSSQGCVPVKWTAPEALFGDIAELSSKSDVYVLPDQITKLLLFSMVKE